MAMLLRERFDLVTLTVRLRTKIGDPKIVLRLETNGENGFVQHWEAVLAPDALGLDTAMDVHPIGRGRFAFPDETVEALRQQLDDMEYNGPLWLHLVKSYGLLGALPWESMLSAIYRPVLRVPDALTRKLTAELETLNIVLCAGLQLKKTDTPILALMAIRMIAAVQDRSTCVHIFTDAEQTRRLQQIIPPDYKDRIKITAPATAQANTSDSKSRQGGNLWLQWIARVVAGTPIDVVHFVGRGYQRGNHASLNLMGAPVSRDDLRWRQLIGADELSPFLMRIGAWSIAFSSFDEDGANFGLRALADEFSQVRPGPVLHHCIPDDPDAIQLGEVYHFLYSAHRGAVPMVPAVALCCQPALAATSAPNDHFSDTVRFEKFKQLGASAVSAALATAYRFTEAKEFEILRQQAADQKFTNRSQEELEGVTSALGEINLTLERLVRKAEF